MATESITAAAVVVEADRLCWTLLQPSRGGWTVAGKGQAPLPSPGADAAAGATLTAALKPVASRLKKRVVLALASEQVLMRVLRLPSADPVELAGMVELQAEKLAPFSLETMVIGHEVLKTGAESSLVLVAAVKTELVEQLGASLAGAGLVASRVDVAVLGWWRTLRDAQRVSATGCQIHVRLVGRSPQLLVILAGVPLVFRTLLAPATGHMPPAELARELHFTRMALELDFGALEDAVTTLWVEDPATLGDWREAVEQAIGTPVEVAAAGSLASLSEGIARRARETGGLMDLTPASWTRARETSRLRRRLLLAASAVVGVWALCVAAGMGYLAYERHTLAQIQAERDTVRGPALEVRDTRRRVVMVQRYLDQSQSAIECLRVLSELLPPEVDLTSFTYRKGEDCRLSGESSTVPAVYELKTRLDAAPLFAEGVLQGPRQQQNGRQAFDLILKLKSESP